jgi:hypothetical protein
MIDLLASPGRAPALSAWFIYGSSRVVCRIHWPPATEIDLNQLPAVPRHKGAAGCPTAPSPIF